MAGDLTKMAIGGAIATAELPAGRETIPKAAAAVFLFQAEDGIRRGHVTGVQTCALPIYGARSGAGQTRWTYGGDSAADWSLVRSEERRVGKECRCRGTPEPPKK